MGQKRLRCSSDNEAKDDNQAKVEVEEVEKKKAKLSQNETDNNKEQSVSAEPGRALCTTYNACVMLFEMKIIKQPMYVYFYR